MIALLQQRRVQESLAASYHQFLFRNNALPLLTARGRPRIVRPNLEAAVDVDNRDGFSLIELIVALSLMAIVAAIALPTWTGLLPSYQLNSSTRQLQSELHFIKMRAVSENIGFELIYRAGAAEYIIERDETPLVKKSLPDGILISKAGTVSFSPRGTAGANRVRLRNNAGQCEHVVVSSTGRVRICKPSSCALDC
jgi:prepilin-type N-terminal cleavage/methylation domain-containing protein